jgi:hypothetical protein
MTPQEQIAYLRSHLVNSRRIDTAEQTALDAVCDLAERALLTNDEAEAVRRELEIGTIDRLLAVVEQHYVDSEHERRHRTGSDYPKGMPHREWCELCSAFRAYRQQDNG